KHSTLGPMSRHHICLAPRRESDRRRTTAAHFDQFIRILNLCRRLRDRWEAREVGRQLLRAGIGTVGNSWSACRARSRREFVARLGVAVDEAEEAVLWLTAIVRSGVSQGLEINSPTHQLTNSPTANPHLRDSMISSSASGPGRTFSSGRNASGSSTTLSW